jgi:hypothetical protein
VALPDIERRKKGACPPERDRERERASEVGKEPKALSCSMHQRRGEELGKAKNREMSEPSKHTYLCEGVGATCRWRHLPDGRFARGMGPTFWHHVLFIDVCFLPQPLVAGSCSPKNPDDIMPIPTVSLAHLSVLRTVHWPRGGTGNHPAIDRTRETILPTWRFLF